jgi:hypothetical protein
MRRVPRMGGGPGQVGRLQGRREVGAVRLRLVVVVAFLAMAVVPAVFAYSTGVLPGPTQASAESPSAVPGVAHPVATLAWPKEPLGLTATGSAVLWEQRDRSEAVAGLWSYNVRTGATDRVLGRTMIGNAAGFPAASGSLIGWATWTGRRGAGAPCIEAYDSIVAHRWIVAPEGRDPTVAGVSVIWVDDDAAGGNDAIRGSNTLTDEEYSIVADGNVRDVAASGSWAAWIAGRGARRAVWTGSYHGGARYRLAAAGTAVAIDGDRVVWAAGGDRSTAVVSWDRSSRRSKVLCRVGGSVSSLALSRRYAAWVTTSDKTDPQVWTYDFETRKANAVSAQSSRQASPVMVAGTLYWADDRSGHWELYARSLPQ